MSDTPRRKIALRRLLLEHRNDLHEEIETRACEQRAAESDGTVGRCEALEADVEKHIGLALLRMSTEARTRIDEALVRLDAGGYGTCVTCARQISEECLRVRPLALRCQLCDERREEEFRHMRRITQSRSGFAAFPHLIRH